jgi:iron complex outermembrane recepter protein
MTMRCRSAALFPQSVALVTAALIVIAFSKPVHAQAPEKQDQTQPPQPNPRFDATVEVVAVTPIHGLGLPKWRVPANVQVFTADQLGAAGGGDVTTLLVDRASSLQSSEAQGGTFQPDLVFRGFVGSPLLGASEGLAVYQDGVRINEAFGDTINWDALPASAIASINLTPGSNPLFGLNTLGGALSLRTKDGFAFAGSRVAATTGSFGRHRIEAQSGGRSRSLAYFVAGELNDDDGWRDFSPSTIRRLFGDVGWRGTVSSAHVNVTAASNDLTGNGPAPPRLLEEDRSAVFTHPDETANDVLLVTARVQRQRSSTAVFDAVAYYRHGRIATFNADAAGDDRAAENGFDAVNNYSRTRGNAAGVTAQITRTGAFLGRENHFIVGAGLDAASSRFDFAAEWAHLTPDRGTIGSGTFDDEAFVDLRSRVTTMSAFVTSTWSVAKAVSLTGSARFNWTDADLRDQLGSELTGDHRFRRFNPAAGITYQMRPGLNLYGSYSQSSRNPTPVELTCADPDDPCRLPNAFVSDPPLEQSVAGTWETGIRGAAGRASWNLSAFTTTIADDIIFVSSGTLRGEGHFENVERTRRRGVEGSFDYRIQNRLLAFCSYSWQRATFRTDLRIASPFHPLAVDNEIQVMPGDRLPGVPAHSAKLAVTGFVTTGLDVGISVRAQSGQYLRGDEANLLATLPAFAVVDAQARQRITKRLTAVVQVQNVLDSIYYSFGALGDATSLGDEFDDEVRFYSPGQRRGAWAGLEIRF